jgi:hypothetical protein
LPSWYVLAQRAGQPARQTGIYQLSGQVNLLAKPSQYLPAQRAGQPARQAAIYQLSGKVNLLAKLVGA